MAKTDNDEIGIGAVARAEAKKQGSDSGRAVEPGSNGDGADQPTRYLGEASSDDPPLGPTASAASATAGATAASPSAEDGSRRTDTTNRLAEAAKRYLETQSAQDRDQDRGSSQFSFGRDDSGTGQSTREKAFKPRVSNETAGDAKPKSKPTVRLASAEPDNAAGRVEAAMRKQVQAPSGGDEATAEAVATKAEPTGTGDAAPLSVAASIEMGAPDEAPAPQAAADDEPFEDPLAACLSFLSKLYGHSYSQMQLRAGIPLEDGRLGLNGMIQAAERIGMAATPERCRLNKIPRLALPAIITFDDGRACVLVRFTSRTAVELYDPRAGEGTTLIPLSEIDRGYSGQVIYVRPQFRFDGRSAVLEVKPSRSWFWGSLLQNWWIYGHAVLATFVVNILAIASPIFVMTVYDRVVPNNAVETLWVLAIGIIGVAVFDFCLRTLRGYLVDVAGKRLDVQLGTRLFDHVVRIRMDSRNSSAGSLASIMREFDFLREFLGSATVTAIGDLPFIFLFLAVIYLIGGPVAYVPMAAVPVVLLVSIAIQIPLHKVTMASMRDTTQKNAHLFEVLHGIETIKAIRAESWAQRIWEQLVGLTAISSMKMKMLSQVGTHVTMGSQLLVTVGIVVVGVHVLKEGDMTQGALIACVLLSSRVMAPLAQVAGVLVRFEQTKTAFNALQGIMQSPVERPPDKKLVHKPHLEGAVEFKEVGFTYPVQQTAALAGISFKIKAGERVAIIGRVGSGKSTVLKLVQNLYEPAEGFVRVDDLDTRQIELSDLRRQVGYVPQDTVLFHGSIRDNLVQGAPHATDEQVLKAAYLAGLDDMIKLSPKGLDQEVGEHGTLLSGGQRQMIVLARALVLDPPILLMDEPTSHMDNFAERQFLQKMQDWLKGRTMILVTHRASLLALVDRLVVMDKGKIVADGPKDEVLKALAAGKIGAAA